MFINSSSSEHNSDCFKTFKLKSSNFHSKFLLLTNFGLMVLGVKKHRAEVGAM